LDIGNKNEKLTKLKKAGIFYRIARNLPSEYDEKQGLKRYQPILDIIDPLSPGDFKSNPVQEIMEIKREISKKYGDRNVLSATTKFLWLKIKQPILIYDSQARSALGTENSDLDAFYAKWREEFKANQGKIVEACSKLQGMNKYAVNQETGTKQYIKDISDKAWFHERVFDIYLWYKGSNS